MKNIMILVVIMTIFCCGFSTKAEAHNRMEAIELCDTTAQNGMICGDFSDYDVVEVRNDTVYMLKTEQIEVQRKRNWVEKTLLTFGLIFIVCVSFIAIRELDSFFYKG